MPDSLQSYADLVVEKRYSPEAAAHAAGLSSVPKSRPLAAIEYRENPEFEAALRSLFEMKVNTRRLPERAAVNGWHREWLGILQSTEAATLSIGSPDFAKSEIGGKIPAQSMLFLRASAGMQFSESNALPLRQLFDLAVAAEILRREAAAAGNGESDAKKADDPQEIPPAPIGGQVTRAKVAKALERTTRTLLNWERDGKTSTGHPWPAGEKVENGNTVYYQLSEVWPSICAMQPNKTPIEYKQNLTDLEGMQIRKSP